MAETYSSWPFISYDGIDENNVRAEVKVVTGLGHIASIEESNAGKSGKVSFKAENTKYLSSGWAPMDSNVMKVVKDAESNGEPLYFRIETRRKDNIDRTIPIDELTDLSKAKDSINKSLSAVKREDDEEWTVSQYAVTNMAEDPKSSFGMHSANEMTQEEIEAWNRKNRKSASADHYDDIEPPPYKTYNPDGSIRVGSIAVSVPLNIYSFVTQYVRDNGYEDSINDRQKFIATKMILNACNKIQLEMLDGALEKPNLSSSTHTRARALVFESIRSFFPITPETLSDEESITEWSNNTIEKVVKMWKWSLNEVEKILK